MDETKNRMAREHEIREPRMKKGIFGTGKCGGSVS